MSRFKGMNVSVSPQLIAFVVCESIDIREGVPTSIGRLVLAFNANRLPATAPKICFYLKATRGESDQFRANFVVYDPSGNPFLVGDFKSDAWGPLGTNEWETSFPDPIFHEAGLYQVILYLDGVVFASYPLVVQLVQ